ncbi:3-epi-6-deoxocathasterone 23-monooxygenase CYP90C1 [Ziziphus jujuba]|uniref:3-epi-6-deoxocathasterone 23-monooxygenase CYP90C1 n=1 Tax=Ziziphus jujuba TaxID=326968 RepID=A0A6P4AUW7_ZIZJJ|nr:3-epi-6-deoxocathasterone 23-monooxygenase CYP90C1 [Ziziphus jujuba]
MEWAIGYWVLVGILVGWYLYKIKKKNREENKLGVPKGNLGWPFVGETLDFIACGYTSKPVSFMEKRRSQYGKVFKTHLLGTPIIVSTDADVNKVVLQNHGNIFIPAYPKSIRELLGKYSILQINGNLQKRLHALLGGFLRSPQFKARITRDVENSVKLCLFPWKDMHLVRVQDETRKITFEVLVKVLMSVCPGEDLNCLKRDFGEFIKGLICLPIKLPGTRLYKSLKAKERMLRIVRRIVEERKLAMENSQEDGTPKDAVDVLLQDDGVGDYSNETQGLSLDFITGNIIEMMIPGEETVPMAMTLAVKYLSDCPVALQELREENMELKQKIDDACGNYSWIDYMSLPFTQNVISETLRMANIINAVWRKALKDVEIKGFLIPKGWCILASFTSIHMDEENYENPYEFDPWRWNCKTGIASANNNNSIFTPFGGGQRLCPGLDLSRLELSIFLHHLVTTYRWVAEKDEIVHFPTVKMKKKLPITVTSISNSKGSI